MDCWKGKRVGQKGMGGNIKERNLTQDHIKKRYRFPKVPSNCHAHTHYGCQSEYMYNFHHFFLNYFTYKIDECHALKRFLEN